VVLMSTLCVHVCYCGEGGEEGNMSLLHKDVYFIFSVRFFCWRKCWWV